MNFEKSFKNQHFSDIVKIQFLLFETNIPGILKLQTMQ